MNQDTPVLSPEAEAKVRKIELLISNLLRTGVLISFSLIVIGMALTFIHHPGYLSSTNDLDRLTRTDAVFPHTWKDVWVGALNLHGEAVIVIGLLVLIATPIMRVAISIFAFIYQNDRVYTIITTVVLCLLLLSFVLGRGE